MPWRIKGGMKDFRRIYTVTGLFLYLSVGCGSKGGWGGERRAKMNGELARGVER